jgi:hypothetical protein
MDGVHGLGPAGLAGGRWGALRGSGAGGGAGDGCGWYGGCLPPGGGASANCLGLGVRWEVLPVPGGGYLGVDCREKEAALRMRGSTEL